MNYLRVWGCPAEAKLFNPHIGKLDPKTVSCHFIGYPERSKGYHFYCLDHTTKFAETRHAFFLEHDGLSGSSEPRSIDLREIWDNVPLLTFHENFVSVRGAITPLAENLAPHPA